jgi:hypothetical protein
MFDRLTRSPGFVDFIRARSEAFGVGVGYAESSAVDLPAYAGSVTLRHGKPEPTSAPTASPSATPFIPTVAP